MSTVSDSRVRKFVNLAPGDPAPWFRQRSGDNPRYEFDTVAGRYIVLCFFGSAGDLQTRAALELVRANRQQFDDVRACFFGVSLDARDETERGIRNSYPGIRFFWDFDGAVSRLYGSLPIEPVSNSGDGSVRQFWVVLDPTLRVMATFPFAVEGAHTAVFDYLGKLPPPERFIGFEIQAPVLFLPHVFEPEFCRRLIDLYEQHGGEESGFMREVSGKTIAVMDHGFKRRKDYVIKDHELINQLRERIHRRVSPEIIKIHCFRPTRMERYIVCCYAADDAAHFRAHRDNTTTGTAHRRFAVSINLNDDFDGGELSFPEYGPRSFKAPVGAAVVFSGSLLHAVSKVTRGRRYAFLPFLYDEEAARLREANARFLEGDRSNYKASSAPK